MSAPAGPIHFTAKPATRAKDTELEVLDGETILGEKKNITEGRSGSFSLTLEEGEDAVPLQRAAQARRRAEGHRPGAAAQPPEAENTIA